MSHLRPVFDKWAEATCRTGARTGGLIEKNHEKRWYDNCCRSCCDILGVTHGVVEIEGSGSEKYAVENIPANSDDDEKNVFEAGSEHIFETINSVLKKFNEQFESTYPVTVNKNSTTPLRDFLEPAGVFGASGYFERAKHAKNDTKVELSDLFVILSDQDTVRSKMLFLLPQFSHF